MKKSFSSDHTDIVIYKIACAGYIDLSKSYAKYLGNICNLMTHLHTTKHTVTRKKTEMRPQQGEVQVCGSHDSLVVRAS